MRLFRVILGNLRASEAQKTSILRFFFALHCLKHPNGRKRKKAWDMARIYDNIETTFSQGLTDIITNQGVKRVDFCVGYFNLRGWNIIVDQIDNLTGEEIYENDEHKLRYCRLLIGMQRPPRGVSASALCHPQVYPR